MTTDRLADRVKKHIHSPAMQALATQGLANQGADTKSICQRGMTSLAADKSLIQTSLAIVASLPLHEEELGQ